MYCQRETAEALVARTDFWWHQRFALAPYVHTPGAHDVEWLLDRIGFPRDLTGLSVLDIGTTNGGGAFTAERRGAARVQAVDIFDETAFGFSVLRQALGSKAAFLQASIYDLPEELPESFDVVLFMGVLYHLRHPLLALDSVRRMTRTTAYIESAVADDLLGDRGHEPLTYFLRTTGEQAGVGAFDVTNWFIPTTRCMVDWCLSSGLEPVRVERWGSGANARAMVEARPATPEFSRISYERPMRARTAP